MRFSIEKKMRWFLWMITWRGSFCPLTKLSIESSKVSASYSMLLTSFMIEFFLISKMSLLRAFTLELKTCESKTPMVIVTMLTKTIMKMSMMPLIEMIDRPKLLKKDTCCLSSIESQKSKKCERKSPSTFVKDLDLCNIFIGDVSKLCILVDEDALVSLLIRCEVDVYNRKVKLAAPVPRRLPTSPWRQSYFRLCDFFEIYSEIFSCGENDTEYSSWWKVVRL